MTGVRDPVDRGEPGESAFLGPSPPLDQPFARRTGDGVGQSDSNPHPYSLMVSRSCPETRVRDVEAQDMRTLVQSARVARLATVSREGHPHLVPICFVLLGETVYTAVDQKPKRSGSLRRITNLRATGHASVLVDEYHEDWSTLWWVRLDGTGRVVSDHSESTHALAALTAKYPPYATDPPAGPVIAIDVRRWTSWSARQP